MDNVLILRSVSLQQLDHNLPAIRAAFPGAQFHLLTHPHAVAECRKFSGLARVIPLDSAAPFSPFRLPRSIRSETYSAAVVPVANRSGAGFLNVFLAAWASGAETIHRCNLVSEIESISRPALLGRWLVLCLCKAAALALTMLAAPPALLLLGFGIFSGRRRTGRNQMR
jgi:hypothetical protein